MSGESSSKAAAVASVAEPPPYRDFSHVNEFEDELAAGESGKPPRRKAMTEGSFPVKLHYMLSELEADGLSYIVSWQPHGRCFLVHRHEEFVEKVLVRWFRQSQLASFQRQLNMYGFHRIKSGPDKSAYYHEYFLRGKPSLARKIKTIKERGQGPRISNPPNFYSLPFLPPTNKPRTDNRLGAASRGHQEQSATNLDQIKNSLLGSRLGIGNTLLGLPSSPGSNLSMLAAHNLATVPTYTNQLLSQVQNPPSPLLHTHIPTLMTQPGVSRRDVHKALVSQFIANRLPNQPTKSSTTDSSNTGLAVAVAQQRQANLLQQAAATPLSAGLLLPGTDLRTQQVLNAARVAAATSTVNSDVCNSLLNVVQGNLYQQQQQQASTLSSNLMGIANAGNLGLLPQNQAMIASNMLFPVQSSAMINPTLAAALQQGNLAQSPSNLLGSGTGENSTEEQRRRILGALSGNGLWGL